MLNHKLSKNVYVEEIFSVVQQTMMSQTKVTLLAYMIIFIHLGRIQQ
jgi:hypothetical protein